jgi:hypothetical protein
MSVLKVGLGHSACPEEAVQAAMKSTPKPTLTVVFCASTHNPNEVYDVVRNAVGDAPIIGGTAIGEFSSIVGSPVDGSVAVMTLQSSYLSVGIGVGEKLSEAPEVAAKKAVRDAYAAVQANPIVMSMLTIAMGGKSATEAAHIKPFVNIVLPSGTSGGEEAFLRTLLNEVGKVSQVVGGSTANDLSNAVTHQFCNGVYEDSGVMAVLSSALKMGTAMGHPYYPSEGGLLVTKSKGRTVYELNNQKAEEAMKTLLKVDELDAELFAENPMGIKSSDVFGQYTIKSAMSANEDGSLTFYAEVPEGAYLTHMKSDREFAIESFKETLENAVKDAGSPKKIGAVIIFSCILRHMLKCRLDIDDQAIIKEVVGESVLMIGFNTFGEQGTTLGGSLGHYNQTATILVIADETITQ